MLFRVGFAPPEPPPIPKTPRRLALTNVFKVRGRGAKVDSAAGRLHFGPSGVQLYGFDGRGRLELDSGPAAAIKPMHSPQGGLRSAAKSLRGL